MSSFWKPTALVSISALVMLVGYQAANATPTHGAQGTVQMGQPNMEAALAALKQARGYLDKAEHNKGGWRASAVQGTDTAISQTQKGIAAGAGH